jgi:hypothetical protein
MAYGLHWEWRGFGTLDDEVLDRLSDLAFPSGAQEIIDRYIWTPHTRVNLKVRSWSGGRSLKLKRPVDVDPESGLELWAEHPDDDHQFPLAPQTAAAILAELGLASPVPVGSVDEAELVESIERAAADTRVVLVRKQRSRAVTRVGTTMVQVERADILEPQPVASIGIEDVSGLAHDSTRSTLDQARKAVCEMRDRVAPRWKTCNYLRAVATWARGAWVDLT